MNKKVFLLLVFIFVFSIFNFETEGARIPLKSKQSKKVLEEEKVVISKIAITSTGGKLFKPTGGGPLTQEELGVILDQSGVVNYGEYNPDDIWNNPNLLKLVTENLGSTPIIIEKDKAVATYDQMISRYDGIIYNEKKILQILEENGIGVFDSDKNILDIIRNKEVKKMLEKEIKVDEIINVLEKESKGKMELICRKNAVWDGIVINDEVIKFIKIKKECRYKCKYGKCIGKVVVEEPIEEVKKEEYAEEEILKIDKNKKKETKEEIREDIELKEIIFKEPQPLSVNEISTKLKEIIGSEKCKPRCEYNCGEFNGCGGKCLISNIDVSGKCGNPIRILEPKTAEEAFISTTINVADATQWFLGFILE